MVGDNLSNYKNVQTLESKTAQGLDNIMNSIRLPYKIIQRYASGGKHFLTIATARPMRINIIKANNEQNEQL